MNTNTNSLASPDLSKSPPEIPQPEQDSPHDTSHSIPTSAVSAEKQPESSPNTSTSPLGPHSPITPPLSDSPTLPCRNETTPSSTPSTSEGSESGDNASLPKFIPGAPFDEKRFWINIPLQSIYPRPPWRKADLPPCFFKEPVTPPYRAAVPPEFPDANSSSSSSVQLTNKEEKE